MTRPSFGLGFAIGLTVSVLFFGYEPEQGEQLLQQPACYLDKHGKCTATLNPASMGTLAHNQIIRDAYDVDEEYGDAVRDMVWCEGAYDPGQGTNFAACPQEPPATFTGSLP